MVGVSWPGYVVCAALAVGCGYSRPADVKSDAGVADATPDMPDAPPYREIAVFAPSQKRDVDMLFVIDDSVTMAGLQNSLRAAFPSLLNVLNTLPLGLPDVHIGVVTSDLGTKGSEDASAGPGVGSGPGSCSGTDKNGNLQTQGSSLLTGVFISDIRQVDGTRTKNYTGSMTAVFDAITAVGAQGCGFEQHLGAAKLALNNNPANAGFLRPNANLVVVIVGDEDDCTFSHSALLGSDTNTLGPLQSFRCARFGVTCDVGGMTSDAMNVIGSKSACHSNPTAVNLIHIADYVAFFKGLKSDPTTVMFAAVVGNTTPFDVELRLPPSGGTTEIPQMKRHCVAAERTVEPSIRTTELVNSFNRATLTDACTLDLAMTMARIGRHVRTMTGDLCMPVDVSPSADCIAVDLKATGEVVLPPCSASAPTDCFAFVTDSACPGTQQLRLQVTRSGAPLAVPLSLRCR
jgi:hypothetical protein